MSCPKFSCEGGVRNVCSAGEENAFTPNVSIVANYCTTSSWSVCHLHKNNRDPLAGAPVAQKYSRISTRG